MGVKMLSHRRRRREDDLGELGGHQFPQHEPGQDGQGVENHRLVAHQPWPLAGPPPWGHEVRFRSIWYRSPRYRDLPYWIGPSGSTYQMFSRIRIGAPAFASRILASFTRATDAVMRSRKCVC